MYQIYYSFSPTIADFERENPIFKETVKIAITPMLTSLSILNYANIDSEQEILGYGISIILMNVGMYFVAPVIIVVGIKNSISWDGGLTMLKDDNNNDKVCPRVKKVTIQKTVLKSLKV